MSSLVGLEKNLFSFLQKYRFWPFLTTSVHLQSRFSQITGKISRKLSVIFLEVVVRNIVLVFEFSISSGLQGGGSRFASRHFPKSFF